VQQSFAGNTIQSFGGRPTTYVGGTTIIGGATNTRVMSVAEYQSQLNGQAFTETIVQPEPVILDAGGNVFQEEVLQRGEVAYSQDLVQEQMPEEAQIVYQQEELLQQEQQMQPEEQQAGPPRVVIVCTSATAMGEQPTGAWSEEITGPYYVFLEAGCEVYIASILGGPVPIDQGSLAEGAYTETDKRFEEEGGTQFLENSFALADIKADSIDCVWLAGGHGTCMDFENNLAQFVTDAVAFGRPVGAVCHGVSGLLAAINQDGTPLLTGKQVTGFSNAEEELVGLADVVPFLCQQRMEELGALYSCAEPWTEYAVADGQIITGQNPQSSVRAAQLCIQAMMPPQ